MRVVNDGRCTLVSNLRVYYLLFHSRPLLLDHLHKGWQGRIPCFSKHASPCSSFHRISCINSTCPTDMSRQSCPSIAYFTGRVCSPGSSCSSFGGSTYYVRCVRIQAESQGKRSSRGGELSLESFQLPASTKQVPAKLHILEECLPRVRPAPASLLACSNMENEHPNAHIRLLALLRRPSE